MVRVTRRFEFSASHRYWRPDWSPAENARVFGKAARRHGHNYLLEVTVAGEPDPTTGMVINLTDLKAIVSGVLEQFDHKDLNDDTPYFQEQQPTTENLVRVLWGQIAPQLPANCRLDHLRLYEQADLWSDYAGQVEGTFSRRYQFSAAHRLHTPALSDEANRALYGKCNNPNGHGHDYRLEVTVAGTLDPATGMVTDLATLDREVLAVLERFDHHHLERDLPEFADCPSTGEHLLQVLWEALAPRLNGLTRLTLWETPNNRFHYEGPPHAHIP
jgi:6-pyruvoyltetrahydropterin/6-carboxytetrahydropterin synthase